MGGARLEIVKFGIYIMFPIGIMYYFGHPNFYYDKVRPLNFWPRVEDQPRIPHERSELIEEMGRLKAERLRIRDERLRREAMQRRDE